LQRQLLVTSAPCAADHSFGFILCIDLYKWYMQEVRLPSSGGEAPEKGASVRLATRTELRRAHTAPEAQVRPVALQDNTSASKGCQPLQLCARPGALITWACKCRQHSELCQMLKNRHTGPAAGAGSHSRGPAAAADRAICCDARRAAAATLAGDALCAGRRHPPRQDASPRWSSEYQHTVLAKLPSQWPEPLQQVCMLHSRHHRC
jgi:hypothetical protein